MTDELPHAAPEQRRPALVQHQCLDCPAWIARGKKVRCGPCAAGHSQKQLYARLKRQRDAKKAAKAAGA